MLLLLLLVTALVFAQRPEVLVDQACAMCHEKDRGAFRKKTPEAIYQSITTGSMREQAASLTDEQKRIIAENLGGRQIGVAEIADAKTMQNHCSGNPAIDLAAHPAWNGWSADIANTRFQPAKTAGLTADQASKLKLKWAFGLPGAVNVSGQPTVAGGRVFISADTGSVYSLDAATGCVYWSFQADAGVRTAPSVGSIPGNKHAVYFGDAKANAYAVDAATGVLLWKVTVEEHPAARLTGAPKLYEGRLYVPVASAEEPLGGLGTYYPCCTFRGSVVALDAATGKQSWKTYVIAETPRPTRKTSKTQLWGPAGGGVWNSPTIDAKRRALYIGTGDAYTEPAAKTTDAIMALSLDNGKVLWSVQDLGNDAWLVGCNPKMKIARRSWGRITTSVHRRF
jgi:polyvinyl alcohol dehydrogenase (cytochrome)